MNFASIVAQNESTQLRGLTVGPYFRVVSRFDLAKSVSVELVASVSVSASASWIGGFNGGVHLEKDSRSGSKRKNSRWRIKH
jgi:hypothetical protein